MRVKDVFIVLGGTTCKFEEGVFVFRDSRSKTIGLVSIHVDDFFWTINQNFVRAVVVGIRSNFGLEDFLPLSLSVKNRE